MICLPPRSGLGVGSADRRDASTRGDATATLFLIQAEREGYGEVGLLIADMRVLEGDQRSLSLFSLDDLPVASQDVARSAVQMMADAYDQLKAEGFDPRAERRSHQSKHGDDHGQSALI